MSQITIRPSLAADKDTILSLIGEIQAVELSLQSHLLPWDKASENYWTWMQKNIADKSGFVFLAEKAKIPVGLVSGWIETDDYPAQKPEEASFGHIQDIAVTESERGSGIGVLLMRAAEDYFSGRGLGIIKLYALANNSRADHFYLRRGMSHATMIYKKYLSEAA